MSNYSVYIHTNKLNGKRYVGITCQKPEYRWNNGNGYKNCHFRHAIDKYGWDSFEHEIVAEGLTKDEACQLEVELIAKYNTTDRAFGYNRSTGGEHTFAGTEYTEERREKVRKSNHTRVISDETRAKMSAASKARGNGQTGKLGKLSGKSGLLRQIDPATGEVVAEYYGFAEMQRKTGWNRTAVKHAALNETSQSHGYKWEYIPRRKLNVIV